MRTAPAGTVKVSQPGPRLRADQKQVLSPKVLTDKHRAWQQRHDPSQQPEKQARTVRIRGATAEQPHRDRDNDHSQLVRHGPGGVTHSNSPLRSTGSKEAADDGTIARTPSAGHTSAADSRTESAGTQFTRKSSGEDYLARVASGEDSKYTTRSEKVVGDAHTKLMKAGRKAIALHDLSRSMDIKEFRKRVIDVLKIDPKKRQPDQIESFLQIAEKFAFFRKHSKDQQWQLAMVARHKLESAENVVFRQEEQPDAVYIVMTGRCGIFKTQGDMRKLVAVAGMGDSVGDIPHLDERCRRSVSVQVSSERAEFMEFAKEDLDRLAVQWRVEEEGDKTQFILTNVPVLNNVPYNVLENLSPYFEKLTISKDTVVYRQQDESNAIFFVWEGRLQIVKRVDLVKNRNLNRSMPLDASGESALGGGRGSSEGERDWHYAPKKQSRSVQLAVVGPGEYFGEVEVFNDLPRASAVIATTDCTLLSLSRQSLTEAMPQSFLSAVFRYSSMRVQWRNSRLALILDNLARLNWLPERDPKVSLEPELKPLAKMRSVLLPVLSHPNAEQRTWLGAHTLLTEDDAREWGLYYHGGWARMPDKTDRARAEEKSGGPGGGQRKAPTSRSSGEPDPVPHSAGESGATGGVPGQAGGPPGSSAGHGAQSSLVAQLRQKKAELLGASYFSNADIKLGPAPVPMDG